MALGVARRMPTIQILGYAHRASTRRKAKGLGVFTTVTGDLKTCVFQADLVVLATPICTFADLMCDIGGYLPPGCLVTDVGSTKVLPHRWARVLPKHSTYIGSHPMAGSEQQGLDYARDDLFENATTIITRTGRRHNAAVAILESFWQGLGCRTQVMTPQKHDRIVAAISHVPHAAATALVNATVPDYLDCAGKGFLDTSRVASGPVDVWGDIFMTNPDHVSRGIDRLIRELDKIKQAVNNGRRGRLEGLLKQGRDRRAALIQNKLKTKELLK